LLLDELLNQIRNGCSACGTCRKECTFLKRNGSPKEIADGCDLSVHEYLGLSFGCSLCGLCTAVCPAGIDPAGLFLEMRRETVRQGQQQFRDHASLLAYEKRGMSSTYSYYGLPDKCDTVFFPGCTLAGTRSGAVVTTYEMLKESYPSLGIVLDCCMRGSHDLGREEYVSSFFGEMQRYLVSHGIKTVLTACPNCHKIFKEYGAELSTRSVYEAFAENGRSMGFMGPKKVTIHDPCVARFEPATQKAVRTLLKNGGNVIEEMDHSGRFTVCCGEGGGVDAVAPDLCGSWMELRRREGAGKTIVTYCAGCASRLGNDTVHVLDILSGQGSKPRVTRSPFTYWKRLRLKSWFKSHLDGGTSMERAPAQKVRKKGTTMKLVAFLFLVVVVVVAAKATGISRYLDQQTLKTWIGGYGTWAPGVYVLFYTVSPALFLPGLPVTIAGGILFGPFWGVVYAIIGATAGASLAFLISRYLARGWVEAHLQGARWKRLDESVERHGWKVVAFTRLVPVFPFNFLNYAFGLTRIGFWQYAIASFFCMLPACAAYIVFSSSLLDLIRGRVSPTFVLGLILIVTVSLIPFFYRRYRAKRGGQGPV
jgi:uncharacterized membrane protein YdjX (TVP38/TMEM64 family)/Fe-S oxidoreductase